MPNHTYISGNEHGTISIFLDDKILMRYFKLIEDASSCLVQIIFILTFLDQILIE